jgi:putative inorganic carbon (hco3(-)) transporter
LQLSEILKQLKIGNSDGSLTRLGFRTVLTKMSGYDIAQRYTWLVWLEPVWVIVLAPVFLFPNPQRSVLFPVMLLLFVTHYLARRKIVESSPANTPLVLLLLMVFVSLLATYDLAFSLPKIAGVLLGAAVYFAIINFIFSEWLLALAMVAVSCGTVVFSALALVGTQWTSKVPILGNLAAHMPHWIKGVPGAEEGFYPNAVAGVLILFLPLQISIAFLLFQEYKKNKAAFLTLLGCIVINAGVLFLSQSRGAWLGLGAGLLLLFAWKCRVGKWLAVAAILGAALLLIRLSPERIEKAVIAAVGGSSHAVSTVKARVELWDRAIYGITDFPFTGMGMNTFRKAVHVLYPLSLISPDVDIANCHNQWLQTALDVGIPGLIAYVSLLAAAIAMGIQIWRRGEPIWIRAAAQGLVSGIIAQQVFGITDAIALGAKVGIFFWIALGAIAAMHRLIKPITECSDSFNPIRSIRRLFHFRFMEALLWWLLIALIAISYIANHSVVALAIAITGGIVLGVACALSSKPLQQ